MLDIHDGSMIPSQLHFSIAELRHKFRSISDILEKTSDASLSLAR